MAKILAVDDDSSIIELLRFLIKREGHTPLIARDGKEGLAMAQSERPDMIILDVMMPNMDGFTVSGTLFKDPQMKNIPIMILTAKGNSRDILELVPNVSLYMEKPFQSVDLVMNIRKVLNREQKAA